MYDETVDDSGELTIYDPDATWKQKTMTNFIARPLLVPIFKGGKLVYEKPALEDIQKYCRDQLATLWPELLRLENPHIYYVDLSDSLLKIKNDLLNARN